MNQLTFRQQSGLLAQDIPASFTGGDSYLFGWLAQHSSHGTRTWAKTLCASSLDKDRIGYMLKRFIAVGVLISALMFTASVEAQSRIVIKRNGKTYIVITTKQNRCETPRRVRTRRHRHVHSSSCYIRRPFRHMRHVNRFYHSKYHARHRCHFCLQYQRWLDRPRHIRCGYNPVIHVYRHRH